MRYEPPQQWTEKLFDSLPDEDDRYEYKSGLLFAKNEDAIKNELAKEICAFANSFGGTLFLGIEDKTKKVDGVRILFKGKQSSKEWLENIIPPLLEFRLQDFRVSEVMGLFSTTRTKIGNDKTLIAIDVFDSDLAPHQSTRDKKYYYRQSSKSEPAPHHYLAYLWGRSNQHSGEVVRTWCTHFLNPLIDFLQQTNRLFEEINSNSEVILSPHYIALSAYEPIFFEWNRWNNLCTHLSAKQFQRIFPIVQMQIGEFTVTVKSFDDCYLKLITDTTLSSDIDGIIKDIYQKFCIQKKLHEECVNETNRETMLKTLVADYFHLSLSHYPDELHRVFIKNVVNAMLRYRPLLPEDELAFWNWCKDTFANRIIGLDETIIDDLEKARKIIRAIAVESLNLANELEELRHELTTRHNTTYI